MYWLSKHRVNHLKSCKPKLPNKIPSRPTIIVSVRSEIPLVLRDNLSLSLPLLLIYLNPFVFIDTIHKPMHTPNRLLGQGFSQIILGGQADLEGPYSHVIKIPIDLINHLPISIRVRFQSLSFLYGYG